MDEQNSPSSDSPGTDGAPWAASDGAATVIVDDDGIEDDATVSTSDDDGAPPDDASGDGIDHGDDAWPPERIQRWLANGLSLAVLIGCTIYLFWVVHPGLVFRNTTPTGGDMGAHVWGPAYLRDELIPDLRLTGWTNDWYAGFPAYTFYMVIPSLAIVAIDVGLLDLTTFFGMFGALMLTAAAGWAGWAVRTRPVMQRWVVWTALVLGLVLLISFPYNIAFKMVAVSGILTLPAAIWYLAKGLSLRQPGPELCALASVFFLMDRSLFHIYGGNIASTMAGEFAFSVSLTLSILALGIAAHGMRDGRRRALGAAVLALAALCHVIPAIFTAFAGALLYVLRPTLRSTRWVFPVGFTAVLLSAWWYIPFYGRSALLNDMGWEKLGTRVDPESGEIIRSWGQIWRYLLPFAPHEVDNVPDIPDPNMLHGKVIFALALIGVVLSIVMVVRAGIWLALVALVAASAFVIMPQFRFWNARVLPFYYLAIYLLAAVGIALLVRAIYLVIKGGWLDPPLWMSTATVVMASLVVFVALGMTLRELPGGSFRVNDDGTFYKKDGKDVYQWGPFESTYVGEVRGWAKWNFEGLEQKPGEIVAGEGVGTINDTDSREFFDMIGMMDSVGDEFGCGRAYWEFDSDINKYGTTMAPMLLPYFTDGCIGSMEGLYFEASSTTPYHFLVQSELSESPSRPQRMDEHLGFERGQQPYSPFDLDRGLDHLEMLGVRYFMTFNETTATAASNSDRLELRAVSGPWEVYELAELDYVVPLEYLPAVWTNVDHPIHEWARPSIDWFNSPDEWEVLRSSDGPADWPRVQADPDAALGMAQGTAPREPAPHPDLEVTNYESDNTSISFDVSEVGSPVLVRTSYFNNWDVSGADGPYRVTPNFMVVIPTDTHVELTYGRTPMEIGSWMLTGLGFVLLFWLARRPDALVLPEGTTPYEFFGDREPITLEEFWAYEDQPTAGRAQDATVPPDAVVPPGAAVPPDAVVDEHGVADSATAGPEDDADPPGQSDPAVPPSG